MSPATDRDPREAAPPPGGSIRPTIALPQEGLPLAVFIALAVILALALFLYLDTHRQAVPGAQAGSPGTAMIALPPPPPALALPAAPPPPLAPAPGPPAIAPIIAPVMQLVAAPPRAGPQSRIVVPPPPLPLGDLPFNLPHPAPAEDVQPALVIDLTSGSGGTVSNGGAIMAAGGTGSSADDTAHATLIHNRAAVIPEGAIIAAVLETPLNSDRPGLARALVAKDARGFDSSRILVPRGSRLIGEFKGDASPGLRRILVTWTRLIRPDGVAIRIGSPVTDAMGGAGVPGSVNTHFAERFASAVLQSALTIGTNLASTLPAGGTGAIYVGLPSQASQLGQQLVPNTARPPTIKVREGAEIAIMVARDLDFSGTPAVR